jgi:hypothetical protein
MRISTVLLALTGVLLAWSPADAREPIGPSMVAALGESCTLDSQTPDGFFTFCNSDGLVFGVTAQLDTWSAWNRSHHALCSRKGLKAFARGVWNPPAVDGPPGGGVVDRCVEELDRGGQHWSVSACPHCRRPMLSVTVEDPALAPPEGEVPDAAHRQLWGDASVRAMTHYRRPTSDEMALFTHEDARFRAAGIVEFPPGQAIPAVVLNTLFEDPDPTVARLAFHHGLQYYAPDRADWMVRALDDGAYGDILVALAALENDERWFQHDEIQSGLERFRKSCPEPALALRAAALQP